MKYTAFALALLLAGCAAQQQQAPVIERAPGTTRPAAPSTSASKPVKKATTTGEKDWRPDSYTVKKGDTLYALGLEFGFDYKDIARWNELAPPYVIKVGQTLKLKDPSKPTEATSAPAAATDSGAVVTPMKIESAPQPKAIGESPATAEPQPSGEPPLKAEPKAIKEVWSEQAMAAGKSGMPSKIVDPVKTEIKNDAAKPLDKPAEKPVEKQATNTDEEAIDWGWPTQGKVIASFSDNTASSKGLDISGEQGQAIVAAAPGKVVYSGSSLRGYGKLVIIKHNKTYLSAYAHNSQILVKEGQEVTKGQKIAEMGNTDADRVKLHFEIRKLGKPVDPEKYIPAR